MSRSGLSCMYKTTADLGPGDLGPMVNGPSGKQLCRTVYGFQVIKSESDKGFSAMAGSSAMDPFQLLLPIHFHVSSQYAGMRSMCLTTALFTTVYSRRTPGRIASTRILKEHSTRCHLDLIHQCIMQGLIPLHSHRLSRTHLVSKWLLGFEHGSSMVFR